MNSFEFVCVCDHEHHQTTNFHFLFLNELDMNYNSSQFVNPILI